MALSSGASPAIDLADGAYPVFVDQRGVERPKGGGFDIGAFEFCSFTECRPVKVCPPSVCGPGTEPLTTLASPASAGTVTPPSGDYPFNSVQLLNATPNPGSA